MHIDSFFACSNSPLEEADFVIFGIPYDSTQSFKPGSRFAPTAIREASWNFEEFSLFFERNVCKVFDAGNVYTDGSFEDIILEVSRFMQKIDRKFVALGGEHTVSYAIAKNVDAHFVIFDAHFDMRDEFDGSKYNHACTTRRILESGKEVTLIGVRSCTREELEFARSEGVRFYTSFDCMKRWNEILKELEETLPEKIYLSVDVDAFDPAYAPGVSTPEPFGIEPILFMDFIKRFGERITGMDVVEVVPDAERVTPALAAKLVIEFLCSNP